MSLYIHIPKSEELLVVYLYVRVLFLLMQYQTVISILFMKIISYYMYLLDFFFKDIDIL